jgi:hypothetical protein
MIAQFVAVFGMAVFTTITIGILIKMSTNWPRF